MVLIKTSRNGSKSTLLTMKSTRIIFQPTTTNKKRVDKSDKSFQFWRNTPLQLTNTDSHSNKLHITRKSSLLEWILCPLLLVLLLIKFILWIVSAACCLTNNTPHEFITFHAKDIVSFIVVVKPTNMLISVQCKT